MKQWKIIPDGCGSAFARGRFLFQPDAAARSAAVEICFSDGTRSGLTHEWKKLAIALCAEDPDQSRTCAQPTGFRKLLPRKRRTESCGKTVGQVLEEKFPGNKRIREAASAAACLMGRSVDGLAWEEVTGCFVEESRREERPELCCFVGLDCPADRLGLPQETVLLCGARRELSVPDLMEAGDPLRMDPQTAPEGAAAFCVRIAAAPERWEALPPEQLHGLRYEAARCILDRLEQQYPGLSEHLEEVELTVPVYSCRWLCPERLALTVNAVYDTHRGAKIFRLSAQSGWLPPFEAGQYLMLTAERNGELLRRPYSISSSPRQRGYYEITVLRTENGRFSDWLLDEVRAGETLEAACPAGPFCAGPICRDRLLMLADSRGLMPFISMVREAVEAGLHRDMVLLYRCPTMETAIFHEQLAKLARTFPEFRYQLVLSQGEPVRHTRQGLLEAGQIAELCPDWAQRTVFLCGEEETVRFCGDQLAALGLPRRLIRSQTVQPDFNAAF